jgi:hypothetical protein
MNMILTGVEGERDVHGYWNWKLRATYLSPCPSSLEGCVEIGRPRGEAVGFQRFRMRVFKVYETSAGLKSNIIIGLSTLNRNG